MLIPRPPFTLRVVPVLVALLLPGGPGPRPLDAQEAPLRGVVQEVEGRPVVGLALSGGAARGLAHIGVIQALEAHGIPVDVVAGTSMGSLVGGLYAMGHTPAALEVIARRFNEEQAFADGVPRRFLTPDQRAMDQRVILTLPIRDGTLDLPSGAVEGRGIIRALERATWAAQAVEDFQTLPRPFAAVATDIRTGLPVVLRSGGLAEAIRASIAIPGALEPVQWGDRLLVDGALVRNLPAADARALGAELLICSDVSRPLAEQDFDTLLDILARAISPDTEEEIQAQRSECDVVLRPVLLERAASDFEALDEWVEVGRAAVEAALPEIRAALARWGPGGSHPAFAARHREVLAAFIPDSVRVVEVRLSGLDRREQEGPARRALQVAGVEPGRRVTAAMMDDALTALQATELYRGAVYALHPVPSSPGGRAGPGVDPEATPGVVVEVTLRPSAHDRLGVGFRYDSEFRASLLLSAAFLNRLGYGSSTRVDLRLGEEFQAQVTHFRGRGVTSALGLGASGGVTRVPMDGAEVRLAHLSALVGVVAGREGVLGVEVRGEGVRETRPLEPEGSRRRTDFLLSLGIVATRDSFDRIAFPGRGVAVNARAEWSEPGWGSAWDFTQYILDVRSAVPLAPSLTLRTGVFLGRVTGSDIPLHHRFLAGGAVGSAVLPWTQPSLLGFPRQSLDGRSAQILRLGLQWEFSRDWFATTTVNAGDLREEWRVRPRDWQAGWGVSVGALTLLGPGEITLSGRSRLDGLRLAVNFGFPF